MALSTADCKQFLENQVAEVGPGPWKRTSKHAVPGGIQRVFVSKDGQRQAVLLEKEGVLTLAEEALPVQGPGVTGAEHYVFDLHAQFPPDYWMTDDDVKEQLGSLGLDPGSENPRHVYRNAWNHSIVVGFGDDEDDFLEPGESGFELGYRIEGHLDDQHNPTIGALVEHVFNDFPMVSAQDSESMHSVEGSAKEVRKRLVKELKIPLISERKREGVSSLGRLPEPVRLPLDHPVFNPKEINVVNNGMVNALVQRSALDGIQAIFVNWQALGPAEQAEFKKWSIEQNVSLSQLCNPWEKELAMEGWVLSFEPYLFCGVVMAENGALASPERVSQVLGEAKGWLPEAPNASAPRRPRLFS